MGILASAFFFLVIGIIAAGNGDFSVLAAIGKGIAGIAFILFVLWLLFYQSRLIDYNNL